MYRIEWAVRTYICISELIESWQPPILVWHLAWYKLHWSENFVIRTDYLIFRGNVLTGLDVRTDLLELCPMRLKYSSLSTCMFVCIYVRMYCIYIMYVRTSSIGTCAISLMVENLMVRSWDNLLNTNCKNKDHATLWTLEYYKAT